MAKLKITEEIAGQNVEQLNSLLAEYDQHIRNDALKILRNLYFTEIKKQLSFTKDMPDLQLQLKDLEIQASITLSRNFHFDFEYAIRNLDAQAMYGGLGSMGVTIFNNDLLVIKQKQDGIKTLQVTLSDNGKSSSEKLDDFVQEYQSDKFHGHAQRVLKTPTLFAQRRHQDGTLHNFWKAVDAILTKLGFGVSTQGVTGAKVDKKIWGMFEKAGVKKDDMEVEQTRRDALPLDL